MTPKSLEAYAGEAHLDRPYLEEQIFQYCMLQTIGVSLGLNLQLAQIAGCDREAATKQLFETMRKHLGMATQAILKNVYKELPINEEDRVLTRKTVDRIMTQLKDIATNVAPPPPDIGKPYE